MPTRSHRASGGTRGCAVAVVVYEPDLAAIDLDRVAAALIAMSNEHATITCRHRDVGGDDTRALPHQHAAANTFERWGAWPNGYWLVEDRILFGAHDPTPTRALVHGIHLIRERCLMECGSKFGHTIGLIGRKVVDLDGVGAQVV